MGPACTNTWRHSGVQPPIAPFPVHYIASSSYRKYGTCTRRPCPSQLPLSPFPPLNATRTLATKDSSVSPVQGQGKAPLLFICSSSQGSSIPSIPTRMPRSLNAAQRLKREAVKNDTMAQQIVTPLKHPCPYGERSTSRLVIVHSVSRHSNKPPKLHKRGSEIRARLSNTSLGVF